MTRRTTAALALAFAFLLTPPACDGPSRASRIVLVTVDTTRADRIGAYGYADATTPHLDALAGESVLFEQAVSVVPTTLPAHSTIFTGQYPQDHGVRYNLFRPLADEAVTLAETLSGAGFATAAFPASQIVHSRYGLAQGFQHWVEPPTAIDRDVDNPVRRAERIAEDGVDLALEWFAENPDGRQFVWLHFYDPHCSYAPPFPYSASFRERPYDGEIAYMDAQLGRLFDSLRDDGRWDDTTLIVVGEHGEGLYEHEERWHTILLYETTQRVPLIIKAPGHGAKRVAEPVSQVDLAPTILDLAGLEPQAEMRGVSLVPALGGETPPRRGLYFETLAGSMNYGWQELRGLRLGGWKLIDAETDPELYDLSTDPGETTNLATVDGVRLDDMRASLAQIATPLGGEVVAEEISDAPTLDPETEALLISLGYASGDAGGAADGATHPRAMIDLEPELLSAQTAVAMEQWATVEDLCKYTLERDGTNRWAIATIVSAFLSRGAFKEADEHADLFVGLYPDMPRGSRLKASVAMARGEPDEAYRIVTEGLEAHPNSEDLTFLQMVAGFESGRASICAGEIAESVSRHETSGRMAVLQARCQAAAGEVGASLASLRLARERGFGDLEFLREQDEFAAVVADPEFEALIQDEPTADES